MEHALLRTVKSLASLLMIVTMISIVVLETFLPEHTEPDSLHGNRILERDFTTDHAIQVTEVSSKNRKRSKAEASKFSSVRSDHSVDSEEDDALIIPLGTGASSRTVPTIKSAKTPTLQVSSSSLTKSSSSKQSSEDGLFLNGYTGNRYHITRYRRNSPLVAHVTQLRSFQSIYDPMIKGHGTRTTRHFPYILCEGSGLIIEPTRAPVIPTPRPTMAPIVKEIEPTMAPLIKEIVPTTAPVANQSPFIELPTIKGNRFQTLGRMGYYGSISDVRLVGRPKRMVHPYGAFGPYILPVISERFAKPKIPTKAPTVPGPTRAPIILPTRAPVIQDTRAPTPLPTPRVFHKVCQDGRVVEIDGTHAPTILPTVAPTFSPFQLLQNTRPPAFVGYVWGDGYDGNNSNNGPKWSFTKNEGGRLSFNHPNLEKAVYRGNIAEVRRQFKRRVDTMSPW